MIFGKVTNWPLPIDVSFLIILPLDIPMIILETLESGVEDDEDLHIFSIKDDGSYEILFPPGIWNIYLLSTASGGLITRASVHGTEYGITIESGETKEVDISAIVQSGSRKGTISASEGRKLGELTSKNPTVILTNTNHKIVGCSLLKIDKTSLNIGTYSITNLTFDTYNVIVFPGKGSKYEGITDKVIIGETEVIKDYVLYKKGEIPIITSISPNSGINIGTVKVTIKGDNFQPGAIVKLTMVEQPEIVGVNPVVVNSTMITTMFDLTDRKPGHWDVRVVNPDGGPGALSEGFRVVREGVKLWIKVEKPEKIYPNVVTPLTVNFGNQSNIEATNVVVRAILPEGISPVDTSGSKGPKVVLIVTYHPYFVKLILLSTANLGEGGKLYKIY